MSQFWGLKKLQFSSGHIDCWALRHLPFYVKKLRRFLINSSSFDHWYSIRAYEHLIHKWLPCKLKYVKFPAQHSAVLHRNRNFHHGIGKKWIKLPKYLAVVALWIRIYESGTKYLNRTRRWMKRVEKERMVVLLRKPLRWWKLNSMPEFLKTIIELISKGCLK